jgi:hypothetical protein
LPSWTGLVVQARAQRHAEPAIRQACGAATEDRHLAADAEQGDAAADRDLGPPYLNITPYLNTMQEK